MGQQPKPRKRIMEGIDIIVDEAKAVASEAIRRSGAESLGENLKETIQSALSARDNVVMVRLNKESLARLDELVDAGLVTSRSEAAAFLIAEGIKSRSELFARISEKIAEIRKVRQELRDLLGEPSDGPAPEPKGTDEGEADPAPLDGGAGVDPERGR